MFCVGRCVVCVCASVVFDWCVGLVGRRALFVVCRSLFVVSCVVCVVFDM